MRPEAELRAFKQRLEDARQARVDYPDRNPGVTYCPRCDEYALSVMQDDGEYERLDCEFEHAVVHIDENHEETSITSWIECLEYVLGERDFTDNDD